MTAIAPRSDSAFTLPASILRAYDIRGIYGETLHDDTGYYVGRAFATWMARNSNNPHPTIVTARDGRASSPALTKTLIQGMVDAGAHVVDCGIGPTPMCYFATLTLEADAGIMLTGSHNPPTHNGFKMMMKSRPFFGDDIQALGSLIAANDFNSAQGTVTHHDIREAYVDRLLQGLRTEGAKPLTVVWDAGNGAAGEITELLAQRLHGTHITLFTEIDGTFPNHHADPTEEKNMQDLIAAVREHKADFGVAFDGDGDRIGAVDAGGTILWGDQMLTLYAREILSRKPGATVIADVKASQTLFDDVLAHGGKPLMWKTGHSLIKSKMKETKAEIAGEMSGHIFFADGYYGFDDGLYAAVRLLDLVAHSDQTLEQMRTSIPHTYNTPEIRVDCTEERKFVIIEEVRARLYQMREAGEALEINEADGVRVSFRDGWWLARASNTQAAIIVRCEAQTTETLELLKQMVRDQMHASHVSVTV
ncbi:MAG: phosphomannomutase/phosphoglucomutase [Alphaproteobacteria bacterium]|nr:MAG: phosphomannomutase/phosphoglucomutase [Alphaproteobacteria bacterium]TAF14618.1 MAG: phosphomannomutase/phosphoglucomutase [Alphaproteobacteria bacterium]TAF41705.1 MAG: phosphomannomutase/phosphoglucomutase [Alphaproteobacteria bacterium]TAF75646.1 MAG: phosphomannomutase/phosphoglucomutase [Alphaproteobacteria bacterium]